MFFGNQETLPRSKTFSVRLEVIVLQLILFWSPHLKFSCKTADKLKNQGRISPILATLLCLPVAYRIDFKILLITFKVLHGLAPSRVKEMLTPCEPSHCLPFFPLFLFDLLLLFIYSGDTLTHATWGVTHSLRRPWRPIWSSQLFLHRHYLDIIYTELGSAEGGSTVVMAAKQQGRWCRYSPYFELAWTEPVNVEGGSAI